MVARRALSASEPAARKVRNRSLMYIYWLLLALLPGGNDGSAGAEATVNVLLFLFRWFENLKEGSLAEVRR